MRVAGSGRDYPVPPVPTLVDKVKTVDLLRRAFEALEELCESLAAPQWDLPSCLPGWSVHDVVSHVVGTESMLLGEENPRVEIADLDHVRNPVAEMNERWVESLRSVPPTEMRAKLHAATSSRLAALETMTQEDFDAPSWTPVGRDETYGRFMRIRHYDCTMHEYDIRATVDASAPLEADRVHSCLAEVESGLGYIVGRRGRTSRRLTGADRPFGTGDGDLLRGRRRTGGGRAVLRRRAHCRARDAGRPLPSPDRRTGRRHRARRIGGPPDGRPGARGPPGRPPRLHHLNRPPRRAARRDRVARRRQVIVDGPDDLVRVRLGDRSDHAVGTGRRRGRPARPHGSSTKVERSIPQRGIAPTRRRRTRAGIPGRRADLHRSRGRRACGPIGGGAHSLSGRPRPDRGATRPRRALRAPEYSGWSRRSRSGSTSS